MWEAPWENGETDAAQRSVIHTGAVLDEHTWGQDSSADQHSCYQLFRLDALV